MMLPFYTADGRGVKVNSRTGAGTETMGGCQCPRNNRE